MFLLAGDGALTLTTAIAIVTASLVTKRGLVADRRA